VNAKADLTTRDSDNHGVHTERGLRPDLTRTTLLSLPGDASRYPTEAMKAFSDITPEDLLSQPVWEFANDVELSTSDETFLRPHDDLPIHDFGNRIVGTIATFANGDRVPIILQNVDLQSPYRTEHFVTITLFNPAGKAFPLARYHDIAHDTHGPDKLAEFMGLSLNDIFPIAYDISEVAVGDHDCVRREVPVAPRRLLSRSEIIELAIR